MRANLKSWREAASVIILAKTTFSPSTTANDFNYKLLTLKRSSKSGFMPGTYVFPGGVISEADGAKKWLKLYENFGFGVETFEKLNPKVNRPIIFSQDTVNEIPKFLTLRITAIRETFEESGILICRSYKINYKERVARWASFIGGHELKRWQEKVHNDPQQFYELCSLFEIYPDVWSLKEWSNWATPASLASRFDTAFFLTAFYQTPAAYAEKSEVQLLEWNTPITYLKRHKNGEILLPPPQFYEISRLNTFLDISYLSKYAAERASQGSERYFPYRVNTKDGMYSILPGDDLYPNSVDPSDEEVPFMQELENCQNLNRMFHINEFETRIIANLTPKSNHIVPVDSKEDL